MKRHNAKLHLTREAIKTLTGYELSNINGGATLDCEKTQLNCPTGATCGFVASCAAAGCQSPTLSC